jgi:hypothetical protein
MWNRDAISEEFSTLTFAKVIPECLLAIRSITGSILTQGLHQGAQKSTKTFPPDFTVRSKFDDVNSITRDKVGAGVNSTCF